MDRFSTTLRALAAPRRAIPIALVVVSLVAVQAAYSDDARAALVPAGLAAAFVLLAPWSWRALVAADRLPRPLGLGLFAAEAAVVVALFGGLLPRVLDVGHTYFTDDGSLLVACALYVVGGWGLGRDIELELDLEHSRLHAVRTHLDPHFLYNTLNAIAEWCAEDPRVAEDATLRLAAMLRDVMDGLERRTWPLSRELSVTEDLLELHRMRDREAFTVSISVDDAAGGDDVRATPVPPLLVVALAENAVKHGPRRGHRGSIDLRVSAAGDRLRVALENPGPYDPSSAGGGRGLAMLRKRLALSYGGRARFTIGPAGDAGRTRATIELPRQKADA